MTTTTSTTTAITILHGTNYERLTLAALATAKGLTPTLIQTQEQRPVEIHPRNLVIKGFHPGILYLENKHPYPSLLFGTPEGQAAMMMLLNELNAPASEARASLIDIIEQAQEADPFLLGAQLSLVDIAAAPYWALMPTKYRDTLANTLHLHP